MAASRTEVQDANYKLKLTVEAGMMNGSSTARAEKHNANTEDA